MAAFEKNPRFSNPLVHASSPYLRQHAHNPVFWYPWGKEAFDRALSENKPILLSIGYSTCYWCHVMEREVFENLSIASLMNANFINIKVDREEYPELDEIYMVARQLMTHEGGWPNNVFLTPDLKPFYAGGTYGPDETYGKPAFPRLLEWLNYSWTTQEGTVRQTADNITETMQPFLTFQVGPDRPVKIGKEAEALYEKLKSHHDERSGGFFQAPKFPHENYLQFLIGYYEYSGDKKALNIVTHSLSKMAAGGFYDHVGCGFHRYAVDKEWYVPHFEKMLYTQALLARNYTDAARLSGNPYFADIAKSTLDFVSGPLTDGNGAFYSALDAETDGVEGAYYAWTSEEIQASLTPEEAHFFVNFYALADIPAFPGHKHVNGQVIVARKPLDQAAHERNMPYVQLAALAGQVMNKLLIGRNARSSPRLDDKIIVAWNGMMIDAFAHAAKVFSEPHYAQMARKAVDFLLEHAIDNEGRLSRIIAAGRVHKAGTLEDYAWLIRGLLTLYRATPEESLLESAVSLMEQADDLFYDSAGGYFFTQASEQVLIRIKNAQDSALPSANAIMLQNLVDLFEFTKDVAYRKRAQAQADYFIKGNIHAQPDSAAMFQAALRLDGVTGGKVPEGPATFDSSLAVGSVPEAPDGVAEITATLFPTDAKPGENCELIITIDLGEGWHINAGRVNQPYLIPTQVDVQGRDIKLVGMLYPEPLRKNENGEELLVYEGQVNITARIRLSDKGKERPKLKAMIRFQPCRGTTCHAVRDTAITI